MRAGSTSFKGATPAPAKTTNGPATRAWGGIRGREVETG